LLYLTCLNTPSDSCACIVPILCIDRQQASQNDISQAEQQTIATLCSHSSQISSSSTSVCRANEPFCREEQGKCLEVNYVILLSLLHCFLVACIFLLLIRKLASLTMCRLRKQSGQYASSQLLQ
jgi:hypothetical protein